MVTILALAAAALYGTADFLGGVASRRASVFAVLALTVPAGAVVVVVACWRPWLGHCWAGGLGGPVRPEAGVPSAGPPRPASAGRPA